MAPFNSRVLRLLDRLYKFAGAPRITRDVELGLPIQLVHDVSREAELGAGIGIEGGWVMHYEEVEELNAGGGTERRTADPWTDVDNATVEALDNLDLWHFHFWANTDFVSMANVQTLEVLFAYPTTFPGVGAQRPYLPIAHYDGTWSASDDTAAAAIGVIGADTGAVFYESETGRIHRPFRIPRNSVFTYQMVTGGICTAHCFHLMWAGPKGVLPPVT